MYFSTWNVCEMKRIHTDLLNDVLFWGLILFLNFLQSHLWHMKVPWLGVKSELPLQAYATAMAALDPEPHL